MQHDYRIIKNYPIRFAAKTNTINPKKICIIQTETLKFKPEYLQGSPPI